MNKKTGILLDSNGDLLISATKVNGLITGGLVVGNTLSQNQQILLECQKGELKENPTLGVGIDDMEGDENGQEWIRTIRKEYLKDGLNADKIVFKDGVMNITADYK